MKNVGIFFVVMKFCNYAYKLSNLFLKSLRMY